jgi:hypothetical protein
MAGSSCVLNLTYAPTAPDSGSFVVNYVYVDNANLSKAPGGSVTLSYQAIPQNNVVATAMPSGQINALVGSGVQSVSVNFSSDTNEALDAAITHLTLTTNLSALPAGWSATSAEAAQGFSCAIVTTGNGCELLLSYQPSTAASGVLTLNYTYVDDSGAPRSGSLNIPYATTSSNNVVATSSPAGQITAAEKTGSQAVAIDFNTDNGGSASGLVLTSNLSALPAGWHSGATSFSCGTVSTGNGCRLALTYAPTALGSGMLALTYAYDDDAGNQQTGSLNVPYAATTNDNVVATASPSGQINAVVGQGPQNVGVVFTTDDTRLATALQVTSDLTMLPAGWSGPGTFTCSTVSTGSGCLLNLSYTPTGYTTPGTLMVAYSYVDNAGQTKSGTVSIPYRATTNDTIVGTPTVAGNPEPSLAYVIGLSTPIMVTMTFATNDGNPAIGIPSTSNAFTITSGLNPLPAGWSSSSTTFSCLTVSDGTVCQLPLRYAPTAITSGPQTLTLGYSYVNDAGFANTGTATISYTATSDNSVAALASPASPITATVGGPAQTVAISFTTNDGNPATLLSVSGLSALLASGSGWSGPSSVTCPTVNGTAATCSFTLTYLPTSPTSGTQSQSLGYSYTNNAGLPGSGSLTLQYSATL